MRDGTWKRDVDVLQLIDGGRSRAVRQGLERLAQSIRTPLGADAALVVLSGLDDDPYARVIARSGNAQASLPLPNEPVDVVGLSNGATRPTLDARVEIVSCLRAYRLTLEPAFVVSWSARPGTGHLIVGMTGSKPSVLDVDPSTARQFAASLRQAHKLNGLRGANRLQRDAAIATRQLAETPPGVEPEKVLEAIAIAARWLLGTSSSYLAMPNAEGGFTVRMHRNVRTRAFRELKVDREKGLAGLTYRQQRPVTVVDYVADARLIDPPIAETMAEGLVSAICTPLIADAEVLGLVYVANRHLTPFTPADAVLLDIFARHAALVLKRSRTEFNRVEVLRRLDQERLAFRLHDSVVRDLLRIGLEAAEALHLTEPSDPVRKHLEAVSESAQHCLTSVREELRDLTAPPRSHVSTGVSVGDIFSQLDAPSGTCVPRAFAAPNLTLSTVLPPSVVATVMAVAEEALANADRHSGASSVTVELSQVRDSIVLVVADDGNGMPPRAVENILTQASGHLGFRRMRRAALEGGGRLTIHADKTGGLMVQAVIPWQIGQWHELPSAS